MRAILLVISILMSVSLVVIADDRIHGGQVSSSSDLYNMQKNCGFSLVSDRIFSRLDEGCEFLYSDSKNSPFLNSYISARANYLYERGVVGAIDLSNKNPVSTRVSYYDDQRDVRQKLLRSKQPRISRNNKNVLFVTQIEVAYDKQEEGNRTLRSVKEKYECWDGIFYGQSTAVSLSLCSLAPSKNGSFASEKSWQAKIIKSLKVE